MGLFIGVVSAVIAVGFLKTGWAFWLLWVFAGLNLYGWWFEKVRDE